MNPKDKPPEHQDLCAVADYPDRLDAEMTRSILESYGVRATVAPKSKTKNPLLGMGGPLRDRFEVLVQAGDLDRARELLAGGQPDTRAASGDSGEE